MSQPESIFTKIIAGKIPCARVYDDAHVFAFLDINPLAVGHTLVVPKRQVVTLHELPPDDAAAIGRVLGRIAAAVTAAVGVSDYNILQNNGSASGQVVPHVHFHIIPRREGDGLGYRWNARPADAAQLAATAAAIATRLT